MSVNINSTTGIPYSVNGINDIGTNPTALIIVVIVIILYYVLFSSLGSTTDTSTGNGKGIVFIEVLLWGVFILLVLLNGMAYIFNINITASIKNLFSSTPSVDIVVDTEGDSKLTTIPEITLKKQVFHIPDNKYDYENSKAICQAYGGRLATYNEINDAYNNGADWCGFGWSDGQMALYPTQYEKWETLQGIKGHEHDCGRPGINGGYMQNPYIKFGVNCYGVKPPQSNHSEEVLMKKGKIPLSVPALEVDKKIQDYKTQMDEIGVLPFSEDQWSKQ